MLTADRIAQGMQALGARDARFAAALDRLGPPPPRIRPRGYETLLRAIVAQQISTAAANGVWRKLEAAFGDLGNPATVAAADTESLRAAGLSRQKAGYAKDLASQVLSGALPLHALPEEDEEAIRLLASVRGLGRWSAEIYLLFAEGRADSFPAGDLAVRVQAGRMFLGSDRPPEGEVRALAEAWRPWRGVAALFLWHCYSAPPL